MQSTEYRQIERIWTMTEGEKERFIKIFFHQVEDTSNSNLFAAKELHDTAEWTRQDLYNQS